MNASELRQEAERDAEIERLTAQITSILAEHDRDLAELERVRVEMRDVAAEIRAHVSTISEFWNALADRLEAAANGEAKTEPALERNPGKDTRPADLDEKLSLLVMPTKIISRAELAELYPPEAAKKCPIEGCDGNPHTSSGKIKFVPEAAKDKPKPVPHVPNDEDWDNFISEIDKLTRERDDARAEVEKLRKQLGHINESARHIAHLIEIAVVK